MNYTDIIRLTSGLLQFGVACYALRLGRLFNAARVGWLLFSGLSLLALAYVLLPINPFRSSFQLALKADLIYALISVLLLAGMVHLDLRFKQRQQAQNVERQAQSRWEQEVEEKFVEVNKDSEESRQTVAKLQSEIMQQKQTQEQIEKTNQELLLAARQTEADLRQTIEKLQTEMLEQGQAHLQAQELAEKAHQEQLVAAHQSGVTAIATHALHGIDNLIRELTAAGRAAGALASSRTPPAVHVFKFIRQQTRASRAPSKPDHRHRPVAKTLAPLTQRLSFEHSMLLNKIQALKRKIALIQSSVQQSYNNFSSLTGLESPTDIPGTSAAETAEPPVPGETASAASTGEFESATQLQEHLIQNVTQTGTETPEAAPPASTEESDNAVPDHIQIGIMPPNLFGR